MSEGREARIAALVNAALLALLAVLGSVLLAWHADAVRVEAVPAARVVWAILALAAWLVVLVCSRRGRGPMAAGRTQPLDAVDWVVAAASQTGYAEQLAAQTAALLGAAGLTVQVRDLSALDVTALRSARRLLLVASTTGEGDAPDSSLAFVSEVMTRTPALSALEFGVLALGDRGYQHFCAFGHALHAWLRGCGARAWFDPIEVDNGDAEALRRWQWQLSVLSGVSDLPAWQSLPCQPWHLLERRLLNPDCHGNPCFHLALVPERAGDAVWEAGDIAEIGPRHATTTVVAWLQAAALDGASPVDTGQGSEPLATVLARSHLPAPDSVGGLDAAMLASRLVPLPQREYSIASLPADGRLELLVRQQRGADGVLGIGSGWLTAGAEVGATIALRIRRNRNFHLPAVAGPLILIGNGTGIAGLRALLKARAAAGQGDNWLLFGERHAAHDHYYRDELAAWQGAGHLTHVDLAFSRDTPECVYVQQRLHEQAERLQRWVAAGAAIYVCGSQHGMAEGVDRALRESLGDEAVQRLTLAGRYRRDVY
ncbi:MAG TPA: sulfite reductase flavoprotein subunit alpha [Rhodanobacteraceae bacterium]|nr:sulfite reductase flavoprotein subunit alpha [Rhodanobacteraceae bacterium]